MRDTARPGWNAKRTSTPGGLLGLSPLLETVVAKIIAAHRETGELTEEDQTKRCNLLRALAVLMGRRLAT